MNVNIDQYFKERELDMAVRRVSDLPNLDTCYPASQLSDCLFEVSYAQPGDPRRYQSFYENGLSIMNKIPYVSTTQLCSSLSVLSNYLPISCTVGTSADMISHAKQPHAPLSLSGTWPNGQAIMDYIDAQEFLQPAALEGIGDLEDLVNRINALFNRQNLILFVAQCGVPYDKVIDNNTMYYDVVNVIRSSDVTGRTLVWKDDPGDRISNFDTNYYTANKDDIIFFRTIPDAVKIIQNFKFLEGVGAYIYVCTNLIEPLAISYAQDGDKIKINSVGSIGNALTNSDMCPLTIAGIKMNTSPGASGIIRKYAKNDKNEYGISGLEIYFSFYPRVILRDQYSFYNRRYSEFLQPCFYPTTIRYLIFDGCTQTKFDSVTFGNYLIARTSTLNYIEISRCAFWFQDVAIIGLNYSISHTSFSRNSNSITIISGSRSYIDSDCEFLSCTSILDASENASIIRNSTIGGHVYIKSDTDKLHFPFLKNAGCSMSFSYNYSPNKDRYFLSAETKLDGKYTSDDWKYVTWDEMKNVCLNPSLSTNLPKFALNPAMNELIPPRIKDDETYKILSVHMTNDGHDLNITRDDFIDFMKTMTGSTGFISSYVSIGSGMDSDNGDKGATYSGIIDSSANAFIEWSLKKVRHYVMAHSNVYNNYETDRFLLSSRFRSLYEKCQYDGMNILWDNEYFQQHYDEEHQGSWDLSDDAFRVTVKGLPGGDVAYDMLSASYPVKPDALGGYSLKQWRTDAGNVDAAYPSPSYYSFKPITSADFNNFKTYATQKYGYTFSTVRWF